MPCILPYKAYRYIPYFLILWGRKEYILLILAKKLKKKSPKLYHLAFRVYAKRFGKENREMVEWS